jgi:hypothetical protein
MASGFVQCLIGLPPNHFHLPPQCSVGRMFMRVGRCHALRAMGRCLWTEPCVNEVFFINKGNLMRGRKSLHDMLSLLVLSGVDAWAVELPDPLVDTQ